MQFFGIRLGLSGLATTMFVVLLFIIFPVQVNAQCNPQAEAERIARGFAPAQALQEVRNGCLQNTSPYWSWQAVLQSDVCRELNERRSLRGILNVYVDPGSGLVTFSPESAVTNGDYDALLRAVNYAFNGASAPGCIYPGIPLSDNGGGDSGSGGGGVVISQPDGGCQSVASGNSAPVGVWVCGNSGPKTGQPAFRIVSAVTKTVHGG